MNTEAFLAWALDDARTRDQRHTVEVLVEQGVRHWNAKRKIYNSPSFEESHARKRERELNPAYEPIYDEDGLRKTAESLADLKNWWPSGHVITNLDAVRFFPALEWVWIHTFGATDISPLADLPALRKLLLGSLGSDYGCGPCEDYGPLRRCSGLREITLGFGATWPDFTGFDDLTQLEMLELSGNLLALPRGLTFPNVRRAKLYCRPLYAGSVADLPALPACEFLTLSGAERLDGIEKMEALRNLTLHGHCRSFAPLASLTRLTWLNIEPLDHVDPEKLPRDISPIATLPNLRFFQIGPPHDAFPDMPRDYLPMAETPLLREINVRHCPPVQMEVASIQAGLPPWDDVFLRAEPRPLGPLQIVSAPPNRIPPRADEQPDADGTGLIDFGMRECESRWVARYAHAAISEKIGHPSWGHITLGGLGRNMQLTVESFDVVEKLPEIVQAAREVIARLSPDYVATFGIHLRVPPPVLTSAQQVIEDRWQDRQDDEDFEQQKRERAEYLERLHEMELKKQQGLEIDPDDFSPSEMGSAVKTPASAAAADDDDDPDFEIDPNEGDDDDEGGVAVETGEDPIVDWLTEGDHPLASNYLCAGLITLGEMWIYAHLSGIGCHLMQRQPDRVIEEEKKEGE